jgi:hypothetical protein
MASQETTPFDRRSIDETRTVSDLVPITADTFDDAVTEVKPIVTGTVCIPKEQESSLTDAVASVLVSRDWIRDVNSVDHSDVTETSSELHVTGEFTLKTHFAAGDVEAETDDAIRAVKTAVSASALFNGVTDVSLRIPPYRLRAY